MATLAVTGAARAEQVSPQTTEQVTKEIMELEHAKVAALAKGPAAISEWFERNNADDLAHTDPISGVRSKAQCIAEFRSGKLKVTPTETYGYSVRVHGNGNTAVLMYRTKNVVQRGENTYTHEQFITDVYSKENGVWQRIVHHASPVPPQQQ
jgi:hypothetical protein